MTNVIRHADATTIELEVATVGDRLLLSVGDDGRGPTPDAGSSEETPPTTSSATVSAECGNAPRSSLVN